MEQIPPDDCSHAPFEERTDLILGESTFLLEMETSEVCQTTGGYMSKLAFCALVLTDVSCALFNYFRPKSQGPPLPCLGGWSSCSPPNGSCHRIPLQFSDASVRSIQTPQIRPPTAAAPNSASPVAPSSAMVNSGQNDLRETLEAVNNLQLFSKKRSQLRFRANSKRKMH